MQLGDFMASLNPDLGDPDEIYRMIARANRLVVMSLPVQEAEVLFESDSREDLDDLEQSLRIVRTGPRGHCMCIGSPSIELYRGDEAIGQITNHHGDSVRYTGSDWNVLIADIDCWNDWFVRRGLDDVRRGY